MFPGVERVPPLPLPVTLFPPLWPGEAVLCCPARLIVLIIAVGLDLLRREEDSERERFVQSGVEEGLQAPASLRHL